MKKTVIHRAFSLIELSVSIFIISIIVSIIAGSSKMIDSARIANARSITNNSPVDNISGLVAWYETSRLESFNPSEAIDGNQVSTWFDTNPTSIKNRINTLSRTPSADVTFVFDGIAKIPSVLFSGSGRLNLASFNQGQSQYYTIFVVLKPYQVSSTPASFIDSGTNVSVASISMSLTGLNLNFGSATPVSSSICCRTNSDYIISYYNNDSFSRTYINDAMTSSGGTINPGTNHIIGLSVGADRNGSNGFNGLISEVIIYNNPISSPERKDVMTYLSQKYNVKISGL